MRGQRVVIATIAGATALSIVLGFFSPWNQGAIWALPALTLSVVLAESMSARLVIGRQGFTYSVTDALLVAALVLRPGLWITVAVFLGVSYVFWRKRRQTIKLLFNITNFTCSTAVAVTVTLATRDALNPIIAAGVGVFSFAFANYSLTALAVSASTGRPYHRVLLDTGVIGVLSNAGNASIGLLGAWLATHEFVAVFGLAVPIGLLWYSYFQQTERASETRLFAEIARGQESIAGTSVDTSAQVIVTAAARVFGGAEVELLLRHPAGLVRYRGNEHGVSARTRAEPDAFDEPWALRALAARGPLTGADGERPFVSAVLGDVERPLALLIVRRPARAGSFTRSDERLASVLVAQAESWLSVADLTARADAALGEVEAYRVAGSVLGELSSETEPALVVLRESTDRLARLSKRYDGADAVDDIVEELHAVERAVASMLGAVALTQPSDSGRPAPEWTTTGRLESADGR